MNKNKVQFFEHLDLVKIVTTLIIRQKTNWDAMNECTLIAFIIQSQ